MEIYIRIHSTDDGTMLWWNKFEDGSGWMIASKTLWMRNDCDELFTAGTPFRSFKILKKEARYAQLLAGKDGVVEPKVTFWKLDRNGKPVEVKFTRDGKMKK